MRSKSKIALLFLLTFYLQNLYALRDSAVAGSFYPEEKEKLTSELKTLFKNSKNFDTKKTDAIIVPHAGYIYSAPVAVSAYKTLNKRYKNIFLIGSSHYVDLDSASIYNGGNYKTPMGEVKVNAQIISKLMKHPELFKYDKNAHSKEHTLEVQLPFLQYLYKDDLRIVPIVIASSNIQTIKKIADVLREYFNDENLFVISTDLSHYPSYEDAKTIDAKTLNTIRLNNAQEFINAIRKSEKSSVLNHQTSACGWSSVLVLLYLSENSNYTYELLNYANSGDTKYGDKNRVVGYGALRIYKEADKFSLTKKEKEKLLEIAKLSLYEAVLNNRRIKIDESKLSTKLKKHLGAFVTLNKNSALRGCIGRFEPNQPLYSVVADMAVAAALQDSRFKKVTPDELSKIDIEISVLGPRKKINSTDEIVLKKHGIYIQNGSKSGTYLPHVATQMGWSVDEFVKSCAIEKAAMDYEEFKNADIFIYETIEFGQHKKPVKLK